MSADTASRLLEIPGHDERDPIGKGRPDGLPRVLEQEGLKSDSYVEQLLGQIFDVIMDGIQSSSITNHVGG